MEDLIIIVVAIAIGLFSLISGQRNKNKKTAPKQQSEGADYIPSDVLERELSVEASSSSQAQPTAFDILGRILSGDLSDLVSHPKPQSQRADSEYIDPMAAKRRKQAQKDADKKERWDIEDLISKKKTVKIPSATALALRKPGALRQAIIISEVLDKPMALRRRKRVG